MQELNLQSLPEALYFYYIIYVIKMLLYFFLLKMLIFPLSLSSPSSHQVISFSSYTSHSLCVYVCVCVQLLCDMSDLSVECSSNVVHFRMCVDSCIALRDLLTYLSARRDLQPRPCDKKDGGKGSSWDYFTVPLPSTTTSTTSTASVNLVRPAH